MVQAKTFKIIVTFFIMFTCITGCNNTSENEEDNPLVLKTRKESIPPDAVKMTPETDLYPPVMHSDEWNMPVPMDTVINTAGGEDSPFIPVDRDELYFFFTPDVSVPAEKQVIDGVSGIYVSEYLNNEWQPAKKVILQEQGKLALDGAEFVWGDTMLFVSAREGYTGLHWFSAEFIEGRWSNWQLSDFNPDYEVGELHINHNELYYHSSRTGGKGQYDIWKLTRINGEWLNPVNVQAVNTAELEGWPYLTADGNELWFTRIYMGSPAIYRSLKLSGEWQPPELIISQFAGEPTLDKDGNIYFVHHFYKNDVMIEADIYVAYKK